MSSNNQPIDQTNDANMPSYKKSINTNMPTSMINVNTNQPATTTTTKPPPKQPNTQQYNLFPEQQQLYILQQELLKQETILSSFKNDSPDRRSTNKEECLTTWQQSQVNEMNESINVIKRENEERKQMLFDIDGNGTMGVSSSSKEEVMLCGAANDHLTTNNNHSNNNNHNMMSVQQKQQQQFIPEPLKLPSKRHPISRRGGKPSANSGGSGGRLTQSLNNEQQQNYTTSYEQRPYSSSFTYGQAPFQYGQQQQQGYGYGGEDLTNSDTFGRPFSQGGGYEMSNPQNMMNNLFNGQDYIGMEQYNINNESKMTRRNSIYKKPNQTNMSSSLLPNTSNYMEEEAVPTINFGNISKPKKRRLNSNEMLLAMLTDTIVSPGKNNGDKDKVALAPPPTPTQKAGTGCIGRRESTLSPPTNLDKVPMIGGDINTPTIFANYFLSNIGIKECKEGDVINTMPPPPLLVGNNNGSDDVQMKEESKKKKKANQIKKKKLPAVVWQPSANMNSSPKSTKTTIKDNNPKPSSHIETPSSETINALSNEIKSNLSSSLASSSSSLYQGATNTTTGGDDKGSSTVARATQPQFALTMEASQASQQSIHDWDKKFGLRRAHSKTMRESCRSRKRVLDFLKGEGSNLLLLKQQMMERTQHQQGQEDDAVLPSLRASTASTSTVSLPLPRGEGDSAVIESAADIDINTQDQEVGMSYEVQEEGEALLSLPTLSGSAASSQSTKKDDQTEILKTHSHSSSDCSKELEQLFRRASLDCTQVITGLARPVQDSDCKSYIAKSA